jgi:hypothetical protein
VIKPPPVPELAGVLARNRYPARRRDAAQALSMIALQHARSAQSAIRALLAALADEDTRVREDVAEALAGARSATARRRAAARARRGDGDLADTRIGDGGTE